MADRPVILRCGSCGGTGGKVAHKLTETLAAVTTEWQPTQLLAQAMRCGETNMSNRLKVLLDLGLVERRGGGANRSPYEWRRAKAAGALANTQTPDTSAPPRDRLDYALEALNAASRQGSADEQLDRVRIAIRQVIAHLRKDPP